MHLSLPWGFTGERREALPDLSRSIGAVEYRTAGAELLALGRGPVRERDATRIEIEPFPDRFDVTYGRRYIWHLMRDHDGHYFLVVNRRDIKPIGLLEAACRWVSASHVFVSAPDRSLGARSRA
jgi:hypothetical protein